MDALLEPQKGNGYERKTYLHDASWAKSKIAATRRADFVSEFYSSSVFPLNWNL